jgi:hypothetical protein
VASFTAKKEPTQLSQKVLSESAGRCCERERSVVVEALGLRYDSLRDVVLGEGG